MQSDSFKLEEVTFEELVSDLSELLTKGTEKEAIATFCQTWADIGDHSSEDILAVARKRAWRAKHIFTLADLLADTRPVPKDVVEGFVPGESVVLLAGKEGVGKSYLLLDLGVSLAADRQWQGLDVHQGGVLVVDKENRPVRLRERFKKLAATADLPVTIATDMHFDLDCDEFIEELVDLATQAAATLIILDSLADFLGDTDENSNSEMGAAARRLRQVSEVSGAAVIVIHHVAKSGSGTASQTARGASAFAGGVDVVTQIKRPLNSDILGIEQEKNRVAEPVRFNTRMIFTDGRLRFERVGEVERGVKPVPLDATDNAITELLADDKWHLSKDIYKSICDNIGCVKSTVTRHIDKLVEAGIVQTQPTDRSSFETFDIRLIPAAK